MHTWTQSIISRSVGGMALATAKIEIGKKFNCQIKSRDLKVKIFEHSTAESLRGCGYYSQRFFLQSLAIYSAQFAYPKCTLHFCQIPK